MSLNSHASTQVIVTSYLFPNARFDEDRLRRLAEKVGKERLVVDVRCVSLFCPVTRKLSILTKDSQLPAARQQVGGRDGPVAGHD